MKKTQKIVLSASRRTDIPAFYMDWFMSQIDQGFFEVKNPFNNKVSVVPATPDDVHTIVFWSKNFSDFIKKGYGSILKGMGYNLFFNFTINSESKLLENNLPNLNSRLNQLDILCSQNNPEAVIWRFDPVCFYQSENNATLNNLGDFRTIAASAAQSKVKHCITSFTDMYGKIRARVKHLSNFKFVDLPNEEKVEVLLKMESILKKFGINLSTCCEKDLFNLLPSESEITQSSCIPNNKLTSLFGGKLSLAKDQGQRKNMGCGCMISRDIGSYKDQPCFNNCLYCYANPSEKIIT